MEFVGSQVEVEGAVDTHLFVLCPNNSGSTFLKNAFRQSRHTWNLAREGQRTFGYAGPRNREDERQLIWAATQAWQDKVVDPANYDWDVTKRAWYLQAVGRSADASVFVEKSPPFLLIPDMLEREFVGARFVMMVRNPYAAYEGIIRRRVANPPGIDTDPRLLAAEHLMGCFEQQRRNIDKLVDRGVFFTYEQLCSDPKGCADLVRSLVPVLVDLDFDQRIEVKGIYDEPLRNMNADQIARLGPEDLDVATSVFEQHREVMDYFGYELLHS